MRFIEIILSILEEIEHMLDIFRVTHVAAVTAVRVNLRPRSEDVFQEGQVPGRQDQVVFIAHQADLGAVAQVGVDVVQADDLDRPLRGKLRVLGLIIRKEKLVEIVDKSGMSWWP